MNESIKKYENHSILRQIELMSYVSSDPNYTDRSKTESSVERAGDISGDPPSTRRLIETLLLSWQTCLRV